MCTRLRFTIETAKFPEFRVMQWRWQQPQWQNSDRQTEGQIDGQTDRLGEAKGCAERMRKVNSTQSGVGEGPDARKDNFTSGLVNAFALINMSNGWLFVLVTIKAAGGKDNARIALPAFVPLAQRLVAWAGAANGYRTHSLLPGRHWQALGYVNTIYPSSYFLRDFFLLLYCVKNVWQLPKRLQKSILIPGMRLAIA